MEERRWRRSDFESANADGFLYVDTASRSVLPLGVQNAGLGAVKRKTKPWYGFTDAGDEAVSDIRTFFSRLINSPSPICIGFAPATSTAISLVAANVARTNRLVKGQSVLLVESEMGSAVYPWQDACKHTGATMKVVPSPSMTGSWVEAIIHELDDQVAVIAVPHVHWCDGSFIDLEKLSQHLDARFGSNRPLLIIDATQSLGVLPFNVAAIKPSFVCCSVHKWLCCPYGMSLMYVAPEFHNIWEPIDHHERSRMGSDQPAWDELGVMDNAVGYPVPFMAGARRFDFGGRPNPIIVPMVREALRLVLFWTPEYIQTYLRNLTDQLVSCLQLSCPLLDWKPREERCGHILGVRFRSWSGTAAASSVATLGKLLKERNVIVSVRSGWLRIAPYVFNTGAEMITMAKLLSHLSLASYPSSTHAVPTDNQTAVQVLQGVITASVQRRLKVIITGSTGWLGQYCCQMLLRDNVMDGFSVELYAAYNRTAPDFLPPERCVQLDLKDATAVEGVIREICPDVVVHLAALSSPAVCHKDPVEARVVNCPVHLVDAVERYAPQCLFIFSSTDLVYDGEHAPYRPDPTHPPSPETVYGETKLAMEREVLRLTNGIVLRLSNMLGPRFAYRNAGTKFLQWLFESYRKREKVALRCDEIRSFVLVDDVLEIIYRAIHRCACVLSAGESQMFAGPRVFNVGGPRGLSRLDLGALVAASDGARLVVDSPVGEDEADGTKEVSQLHTAVWKVGSSTNAESIVATGIANPRDVTMNSEETERVFGMQFTTPGDAVNKIKKDFLAST